MVKFVNQPKEDYSSLQKRKLPYPYPYKTKLKSVQNFEMEPLREHGQSVNSFFKNKIGHKIKNLITVFSGASLQWKYLFLDLFNVNSVLNTNCKIF